MTFNSWFPIARRRKAQSALTNSTKAHAPRANLPRANLLSNDSGVAAVHMAILLPVFMGFSGLAVDTGSWYADKRSAQNVADAAVIAAAMEVRRLGGETAIQAAAMNNAELNGYDAHDGDSITVNWPPKNGPYTGDPSYVEAIVDLPANSWFSSFFLADKFDVQARAVAGTRVGEGCVMALSADDRGALTITGTASITLDCTIRVNSDDPEAVRQMGTSCFTADGISISGGYTGDCVYPTPSDELYMDYYDPLDAMPSPAYGSCTSNENIRVGNGQSRTIDPGVYCGNIGISGDGVLTMSAGMYVLDRAGLDIAAQSTLTGTGIFIYMTPRTNQSNALNIQGGATVNLTAGTTGTYAGILFWDDSAGQPTYNHSLTGGSTMNLDGVVYAPHNEIIFAGGADTSGGVYIISENITFTGETTMGGLEGSTVATSAFLSRPHLVE